MNKEEFKNEISILFDNYNHKITKDLLEYWYESLKQYDCIQLRRSIKKIILNNQYFPTLAIIILEIKKLNSKELRMTPEDKKRMWAEKGIKPKWLDNI